ncbi:hypothetical protein [Rudaea cellulosilytica]|uniref:hypothetical protein n=1 Tax=Rudaea cellulosilytica TaxID=540746 RepID=UPI0003659E5C|nr:hypothetical protein [Rudaea cellulosilytica]
MNANLTFFPVDNGDMTLVRLADSVTTTILIDVNIRVAADDPEDTTRDVAADLRARLPRDEKGRPYVDAFLLSHPDKDHCTGFEKHFHLGPLADYADDKKPDAQKRIVIREIWSSPIVFRRACKTHPLCSDAQAFNKEAKRRVQRFRDCSVGDADRILILGEDENGKTDDLTAILVRTGDTFQQVNGCHNSYFSAQLLAPRPQQSEEDEAVLSKNHSSTILNMKIASSLAHLDSCRFLTAGDAEVAIWERLWTRYKDTPDVLAYDVLQAPHHCSWHTLSNDSWSQLKEKVKVSADARSALAQARTGALIIASCKPIKDDDADPPCIRAQREYKSILTGVGGLFFCTGETPNTWAPEPLEIEITAAGAKKKAARTSAAAAVAAVAAPRAG